MLRYANKNSHTGFILITVLIFLQVLSLLGWYAVENVLLEIKTSRNFIKQSRLLNHAELFLEQIEQEVLVQLPSCQISPMNPEATMNQTITWWQSVSCAGNFQRFQYYYIVESLGADPCAYLAHNRSSADYYRITLFFTSESIQSKVFLQSTIVLPIQLSQQCNEKRHEVQLGRQSWREIN
ncbi:MAG: hypothetical protein ABI597_09855 [Gammaproteobacteria bacterium]